MAVAGASDAVDGWLARHFDWVSRFGTALDPLADKILVGVLFVVLTSKARCHYGSRASRSVAIS